MVDALTLEGDEGRGVAAISLGEVPSNLRSGDFRMGKPCAVNQRNQCFALEFSIINFQSIFNDLIFKH